MYNGSKDLKETKDNRAEERRNQILAAAAIALARKGYHATTMDDIVAESGLSKGSLYLYFGSKKDIFLALCDQFNQSMNQQVLLNLAGKTSFVDQMRAVADAYVQVHHNQSAQIEGRDLNVRRLTAEFWQQAAVDPDVKAKFIEVYQQYTQLGQNLVEAAIAAGEFRPVDAATLTMIVMAVFDGLTWRWVLNSDEVDWPRSVDMLFEILLRGASPSPIKV